MEKTTLPGSLTILFPCFNDSRTMEGLIHRSAEMAGRLAPDFEILAIDDGSTDNSLEILNALKKKMPFLRVISHGRNLGYGAALRSGFYNASNDFIFYTDGDGQYDPRELEKLVPLMKEGIGLVNGYKIKRSDALDRVIAGNLYAAFVKVFFGLNIKDPDCDFRLFRKSVLPPDLKSSSGAICVELVKKIQNTGTIIEQVPVSHFSREFGRSQFFNFKAISRTFKELAALSKELRAHGRK